jgi:glycosyltransferase involved in cell wall biosynthesis
MPRALVLSQHGLEEWHARYRRGEASSPLPYGVEQLEHHGWSLHAAPRSATGILRKVRDVVEHRTGLPVERQLRGIPAARSADLVLALLEQQGWLPSLMRQAHLPPYSGTPLVLWTCWLADDARRAGPDERARLARLVAGADLVTHLSAVQGPLLAGLGVPRERLLLLPFGVSEDFYVHDGRARDLDLLAVGQDRGRDYRTLVEAVRGTDLTLDLVCRAENVAGIDLPANVRFHGTVPLAGYRDLLRRARVVAVPTHELAYPTGQSVVLEAGATGCAVAVTDTPAIRDYVTDGDNGRLVPHGDVVAWRSLLLELRDDEDQRRRLGRTARDTVEQRFTTRRMWSVLADELVRRGLEGGRG